MCGIAGVIGVPDCPALRMALTKSLDALEHRGPDDAAVHIEECVALGYRRLAIIDVEHGRQPVFSEDRSVVAVFNGEIYNYVELRTELRRKGHAFRSASDSEVIVHLYEEHGPDFVHQLRGMFAIAIFDRRQRRVVLARDRFGKKPLHFLRNLGGDLAFASELKGLLPLARLLGHPVEVNPEAIYHYLSFASVPQPSTIYRGVRALPAASMAVLELDDTSRLEIRRYWAPTFRPKWTGSHAEALERTRELIAESVRLRLRSDVEVGAFLSGGVDSSIVVLEAVRQGQRLRTFTIATRDAETDESDIATRTARSLGVPNEVIDLEVDPESALIDVVRAYDQPFADPSAIPSLVVSRATAARVKVVLNGDGGDELFGGYRRYLAVNWASRVARRPIPYLGQLGTLVAERVPRRGAMGFAARFARVLGADAAERYLLYSTDMLSDAMKLKHWRGGPIEQQSRDIAMAALGTQKDVHAVDAMVAQDVQINLLSGLLVKMDIASSAASLEARSPFLDHVLAEWAFRLPVESRFRGRTTKALLREAYADSLPPEVVHGAKRGFEVPLRTWIAGPWRDMQNDLLGGKDARVAEYLNHEYISSILSPRRRMALNRPYVTYALLILELWLRTHDAGEASRSA